MGIRKGQGKHDPPNLSETINLCANLTPTTSSRRNWAPKSGRAELTIWATKKTWDPYIGLLYSLYNCVVYSSIYIAHLGMASLWNHLPFRSIQKLIGCHSHGIKHIAYVPRFVVVNVYVNDIYIYYIYLINVSNVNVPVPWTLQGILKSFIQYKYNPWHWYIYLYMWLFNYGCHVGKYTIVSWMVWVNSNSTFKKKVQVGQAWGLTGFFAYKCRWVEIRKYVFSTLRNYRFKP